MRPILKEGPSAEEIRRWQRRFDLDVHSLLSTRSRRYRELNLKENPPAPEDLPDLLGSEPRLLRRPILVHENGILIGFKEDEYAAALL